MNYELAKKLKDAGFPNQFSQTIKTKNKGGWGYGKDSSEEGVYYPTLSELIEACIKEILENKIWVLKYTKKNIWSAYKYITSFRENYSLGNTPKEAVAHLWLAIKYEIRSQMTGGKDEKLSPF